MKLLNKIVQTNFGTGRVVWVDKNEETVRVSLGNKSIVSLLVTEIKTVKKVKLSSKK